MATQTVYNQYLYLLYMQGVDSTSELDFNLLLEDNGNILLEDNGYIVLE